MVQTFTLGLVGAPFGLKGFVKVKPFSGETAHFTHLEKVTLKLNGKENIRDIAEALPHGDFLLMRFKGIDNPEAAGLLTGSEIIAGRDKAAPLKEGEVYVEDLKGLDVLTQEGEKLGHIADVVEGGGGDLVEIALLSGEKRFAPFRKEFFEDANLSGGNIVLLAPWVLE